MGFCSAKREHIFHNVERRNLLRLQREGKFILQVKNVFIIFSLEISLLSRIDYTYKVVRNVEISYKSSEKGDHFWIMMQNLSVSHIIENYSSVCHCKYKAFCKVQFLQTDQLVLTRKDTCYAKCIHQLHNENFYTSGIPWRIVTPNWQWRFNNLIFPYNNYIRQKCKWYIRFLKSISAEEAAARWKTGCRF